MTPSAQAANKIEEIRVEGAQRIEPATVVSYLKLNIGDTATRSSLDRSLKALFATGLFADVSLRQEESVLVVKVAENPLINQIAFEGNEKVKDEELQAEIQLLPRQVFTRTKVQNDVRRLYQVYRRNGRFSVNIDPKVIRLDQNRVDLVFEIQEGDITKVESIRFVGNRNYSDSRLRTEISTKESCWYRFLTADDRYDPDRVSYDQELLRRFYLSQGYADFRIVSAVAELAKNQGHFYITFTVEEGNRYALNSVNIESRLRDFDAGILYPHLTVKEGEWYNATEAQKSVDALTDALGDMQYAFVNIKPISKRNTENNTIDLTFVIEETPRVFVERIDIKGNVRTLDKVVRREMKLVEGDPFNKSKLARSEQKIRDLDFFESVDVNMERGSAPDKTVLNVDVAEKSTGELSLGAGFSTNDGPLADFRIRERNFLGRGQDLLFASTISGERTEFDVSFVEPYFMNRDLAAGIDAFHITRDLQDESSYDQTRSGAGLSIAYPLSERWRQKIRYRVERNEISDVDPGASRFIRDQEGTRDTSAISQTLSYNSLDSNLFPTEGLKYWFETELAGLGGDAQYVSAKTGASYFYPVWEDDVIFNLLGEVAAIEAYSGKKVAINERYFIGGNTLRGFENAGIGPRDSTTDDALGGNRFYRGSAELSFPVFLPEELGVKGHAFSDVGSLWGLDDSGSAIWESQALRASVGLGLSWRSPFGPVRFDFAEPIADEKYDKDEFFRFNFGTRF